MVLMKGEAITAGSNPIFSAKMGREAPTSLAQATVPTRVQHTTAATAGVTVGDESFQMLEWDAVRFPADQPWRVDNQSNSTVRLHLTYRYAKP